MPWICAWDPPCTGRTSGSSTWPGVTSATAGQGASVLSCVSCQNELQSSPHCNVSSRRCHRVLLSNDDSRHRPRSCSSTDCVWGVESPKDHSDQRLHKSCMLHRICTHTKCVGNWKSTRPRLLCTRDTASERHGTARHGKKREPHSEQPGTQGDKYHVPGPCPCGHRNAYG